MMGVTDRADDRPRRANAHHHPLMARTTLAPDARYASQELIYRSARTTVHRAVRRDGVAVVVKSATEGQRDPSARRWLLNEHRVLEGRAVPGSQRVLDLLATALGPAMESEDFRGTALNLAETRAWSVGEFLRCARELAEAVRALHAEGITHRDLVPGNILRRPDGSAVCLIDFGLATRATRVTHDPVGARLIEGTLGFLSPEQTGRLNRPVDRRADLYTLGATFFALLTGRPPFEGDDPVALVHATVALPAPRVDALRPDVPAPLAALIARLLAKMPDDRYQTADALARDLALLDDTWRAHGSLDDVALSADDRPDHLVLPDRLYGREGARHDLQEAIARLRAGVVSAIAVVGPAGVGKTALVRELHRMLAATDAAFAEGKVDPLQRGTPYAPVLAVLRALMQRALAGDDQSVLALGRRLRDALGEDRTRLVDLVPEAAALVGPEESTEALLVTEARARLHVVLRRSLQVFHAPERPLVVFLDDLQWADEATLSLVRTMVEQRLPEDPLLVLGWRATEGVTEGAMAAIEARWASRSVPRITVGSLGVEDVAALLGDALGGEADAVADLAALLHQRTSGNAQMVRELLTSLSLDGAFPWDGARHRLTWDLARIAAAPVPEGVAELLTPRLARLPARARHALEVAACVGGSFDPTLVRAVTGATRAEFASAVSLALEAGLLVGDAAAWEVAMGAAEPSGPAAALRFAHDRVHDAVYASLSPARREETHLALGRQLLRELADGDDDRVFATVDQMRRASAGGLTRAERLQLAALGLRAARRARQQAAFEAAFTCAGAAIGWLEDGDWAAHYELTRDLHLLAAEMVVLCPGAAPTVRYAERALARARDALDRVAAQSIVIRGHNARADHAAVVHATVEALRWLGVDITEHPGMPRVLLTLARVRRRVGRLGGGARAGLAVTTDPAVLATQALISGCTASAYLVSTTLLPMLLLRSVELSLDRGASAGSAYGFAGYTFILAAVLDDLPGALRFAALSRALAAELDDDAARVRVETLCVGFCDARVTPQAALAEPFADLARRAAAVGDGEYAALNAHNTLDAALAGGRDLDLVAAEAPGWIRHCALLGEDRGQRYCGYLLHATDVLRGRKGADEAAWAAARDELYGSDRAPDDKTMEATFHVLRISVTLFLGDTATAASIAEGAEAWIKAMPGAIQLYPVVSHIAQARLIEALGATGRRRVQLAALAARDLHRLRGWAAGAPAVFGHRVRLVEALGFELAGQRERAVRSVEAAVSEARLADVTPDLALALDAAARIYERHGQRRVAASLLGEALEVWRQWGAKAVVARLDPRLSALGAERLAASAGTTSINSSSIDAATLMRAARALSAEIVLDDLLRRLVELATTNAGADQASLWLVTPEGLRVTARARAHAGGVVSERVRDDLGADDPAAAVVQYVARTQEPVLLHDAAGDQRFFQASGRHRPRSVLCVPLRKGHHLIGVLYLHSAVVAGAFTEDRFEMATVMAAQAAVSIENARLYDDLRASLERQQKLTAAFERFMPNQFLEQLEKPNILDVALGDQSKREVTVLFCDLRGFSALASQLGPAGTFAFINRYLGYMEPVIHAHGGFINQYLGDGIMALFPGSTDQAVAGALAMLDALAGFNAERRTAGLAEVRVSIGLNSGPLMLGVIGGAKRFDRGVVGDAVNLASRVEGMTRQFNAPVLLGGETCARLEDRGRFLLRSLGWVVPLGQRKPIEVFEALDAHGPERRAAGAASAGDYADGLARWVAGDFVAAIRCFAACMARDPLDGAARFMVARCEDLIARPPQGSWDGIIRLVSK